MTDDSDAHAAIVSAAIADASSEIDAALAVAYDLPLGQGPWPVLESVACDLARARLYDDAPPENVVARQNSARARLREMSAGSMRLVDEAGRAARPRSEAAPAPAPAGQPFSSGLDRY